MIADLHIHYPMHLIPEAPAGASPERVRDRKRAQVMERFSRYANYRDAHSGPRVTVPRMRAGGVSVACSVLYNAFDELEPGDKSPGGPRPEYYDTLCRELDDVEAEVAGAQSSEAAVVRSCAELDAALDAQKVALVHCVEGGFRLGATPEQIHANVRALKAKGVVYITLAHLFFRGMATNAPALPALGADCVYNALFAQPEVGLTHLGLAAVDAMRDAGILIDLAHMSERAVADTLNQLDRLDARAPGTTPVIASHSACRLGALEYNLSDGTIARIHERGGVIGLLNCPHFILDGLQPRAVGFARRTLLRMGIGDLDAARQRSLDALSTHIDRVARVTGSHDAIALGSDLDGYVKPTLDGIDTADDLRFVEAGLRARHGAEIADKVCHGNALRLVRWALG